MVRSVPVFVDGDLNSYSEHPQQSTLVHLIDLDLIPKVKEFVFGSICCIFTVR